MKLTKSKTDNLFLEVTDTYAGYKHVGIMTIDDELIKCLKTFSPIVQMAKEYKFHIETYNVGNCGLYKMGEDTSKIIKNYDTVFQTDKVKVGYLQMADHEWDDLDDYNDTEVVSLRINSRGYFYYHFETFLDTDGGIMSYETEPLQTEWFLTNYKKGLFI